MVNNKVLIIDDERIVIESIKKDLKEGSYIIFSAMNGREGLEKYSKEQPALVILDLRMPNMSGIEFLEQIKLKPSDPSAVIVLTGHGDEESIRKCFNLGISSFIRKPYNIDVLRGTVMNSIELKQMQQRLLTEINERKRVEKELRESENKLQSILDNTTAVICMKDTQGRYILINKQYENIFNVSRKEVIGKTGHDIFPRELAEVFEENDRKVLEAGTPLEFEEIVPQSDGIHTYISLKFPLANSDDVFYRICSVSTDITERKRMDDELIKVQKLESVGVLAGGIAHDFNNNLQVILGNIALARLCSNPNEEIFEHLIEMEKAIRQAKGLTQQLLTFSKGGDPVKKTISITKLITDSANLVLSGSNVSCEFYIPDNLWQVEADEGQMGQVINNLIINADQAMPEGGIIKIRAANATISAKDSLPLEEGRYVKITIQDQGTGISKKHLQKIFDPYFTTKQKGNGLGLTTSYSILKKHGGYISAESEMGVGTTFHFYLPTIEKKELTIDHPSKPEEKKSEEIPFAYKNKILLMDDEASIRFSISKNLSRLNYDVETTDNGTDALKLYKSAMESGKSFDVVILDLTIPGGMGGEKVIKKLLEIDPHVRAIVSSGYANDPVMANYRAYGFCNVIAKPYAIKELYEVLQKVIKNIGG